MEWNRSETLGLAAAQCLYCKGSGVWTRQDSSTEPCNCVLRKIFRICYARFVECTAASVEGARCSLENAAHRELPGEYGRKNEEYVADFLLIAKRTLTPELHRIFRYRYILGADWRLCCRKLNMEKGRFYQLIYYIQQKLGRVYRETQPYSLYPLAEYFSPTMRTRAPGTVVAFRAPETPNPILRPLPLGRAA